MIIKLCISIAFFLLLMNSYSLAQTGKMDPLTSVVEIVRIRTDSLPGFALYHFKGKTLEAEEAVFLTDNVEQLQSYLRRIYWAKYKKDDEINASCIYSILLDKKLKIKDVQILHKSGYDNSKYDYDSLIKETLHATQGIWRKRNAFSSAKWYFVLGRFRIP